MTQERPVPTTYRVPVRIDVDVDFPAGDNGAALAGVTQKMLHEAARQTVLALLPEQIAQRCIITAGRTASGGLINTEYLDGGAARITATVPQLGDPILDDIDSDT